MNKYVLLIRAINVGGRNKVPMSDLKESLEGLGFSDVVTYIASGNVVLSSDKSLDSIRSEIVALLAQNFNLDGTRNKILVLNQDQLEAAIGKKPDGFGEQPDTYHSDMIFLMDLDVADAMRVFKPREGVDTVWPGDGVIYSQRLSAERSKSRLSKIVGTPAYKSMTIRTYNTCKKLHEMLKEIGQTN